MVDQNSNSTSNGATPPSVNGNGSASHDQAPAPEPRQSLREVAEAAWDEVVEDAPSDDGSQSPAISGVDDDPGSLVDSQGRRRDASGRFASVEPGEQSSDPAPNPDLAPPAADGHPAPVPGSSNEPPANWSADDKATFAKMPDEGKAFLLRRHGEMESDYHAKVQASATATKFTEALAPVFNDEVIAQSLNANGATPYDAITQWAGFHKRAMNPDAKVRLDLIGELAQRLGFDPAALFGPGSSQPAKPAVIPGLSEADMQDPAIRYFADQFGRLSSEIQAQRNELQQRDQAAAQQREGQELQSTRWNIDKFADEIDTQGRKLRPDFDQVLPQMLELFRANPQRDLVEAYNTARWMNEQTRTGLLTTRDRGVQSQQDVQRAQAAVRGNVRGMTARVGTPPQPDGQQRSLRDVIEDSADEVGF